MFLTPSRSPYLLQTFEPTLASAPSTTADARPLSSSPSTPPPSPPHSFQPLITIHFHLQSLLLSNCRRNISHRRKLRSVCRFLSTPQHRVPSGFQRHVWSFLSRFRAGGVDIVLAFVPDPELQLEPRVRGYERARLLY